jgi:hypothetical protein
MYDCDCPYCNETNTFFEVDGCINKYVPRMCEHCGKIFYNLQRSFFDPFYDNMNVEVQRKEWMDGKIEENQVQEVGAMRNEDGVVIAHIYTPLFDIYEKNGGREHAEKVIKKMFNLRKERIK